MTWSFFHILKIFQVYHFEDRLCKLDVDALTFVSWHKLKNLVLLILGELSLFTRTQNDSLERHFP